jgi:hypothetical protein
VLFLHDIGAALQLGELRAEPDFSRIKRAFTPAAVRKIYESVVELWPDGADLERVLRQEATHTSGLYVGTYEPEAVFKGVARHSLYSDTILLVDPFVHPSKVRPKYNPALHPEKYRTTALKCVAIWFAMWPWIEAGIVKFVHLPEDFDFRLGQESMRIQDARRQKYPELTEIGKRTATAEAGARKDFHEYMLLLQPDESLRATYNRLNPAAPESEVEEMLAAIRRRREAHPYYLDPVEVDGQKVGELIMESSGASYDMAKRTALLSGSYLITDLEYRWKEIELDRAEARIDAQKWSPFAKAFHNLDIKYLQHVPLEAALQLRQRGRLDDMRGFLRKVWRQSASPDSFDDANVENLAAELREKVREAEEEWAKIDRELLKWFGTFGSAAGAAVAIGAVEWLPAAFAAGVTGAAGLAVAGHQRYSFERRYPAGLFLKLKKQTQS